MSGAAAATADEILAWSASAYGLLERIRVALAGQDAYQDLVAEINVLLDASGDTAADGRVQAGAAPPTRPLEGVLAIATELLRLFAEHDGQSAGPELVAEALELVRIAQAEIPTDVLAEAKQRAVAWEEAW